MELLDTIEFFFTKAPSESREVFKQTEQKLIEFTKSDEAWDLGLQILKLDQEEAKSLSQTQLFFAANTLKSKMIYDFDVLKNNYQDVADKLGDEILDAIKRLGNRKFQSNVLSSLCLALAIYGVHKDNIPQISDMLGSNANELCGLLLVIKYMSEEAYNDTIVVHEEIRLSFLRKLKGSFTDVLKLLNSWATKLTVEGSPELESISIDEMLNIKAAVCETLYSWILVDIKEEQFKIVGEECQDLFCLLFEQLSNEYSGYLIAAQTIAEVLLLCKKFKNYELSSFLKMNLLLLEDKCQRIIDEEDIEAIETYASMYADLADASIENIANGEDLKILKINLMFYEIEGKHFKQVNGLFGHFGEFLKQKHSGKINNFGEFFQMLIEVILKRSKIPHDLFKEFDNKNEGHPDFDDLGKLRIDLGKLLKKIGLGYGHHQMYTILQAKLKELVDNSGDWSNFDNIVELENLLFNISFGIQLIDSHEEIDQFEDCITLSLSITSKKNNANIGYAALRRAVIDILHLLAEFYKKMDKNIIKEVIEYIVEGFHNKNTFDVSSQCFERIVLLNLEGFHDSLETFLEYMNDFAAQMNSYNPLWAKSFKAVLTLAGAVHGENRENFKTAFEYMLTPFMNKLMDENSTTKDGTVSFEFIADLYETASEQIKFYGMIKEPVRDIFINIWPILAKLIDRFSTNEKAFEANTRLIKRCFRALQDKTNTLDTIAKEYLDKIIQNFQENPSGWLIYPGEVMFQLYAGNSDFTSAFYTIIQILITKTFEYIDSIDKIRNEPFLATDLFSCMSKVVKRAPKILFTCDSFTNLIEFSILGIEIEHHDLSNKLGNFICDIFYCLKDIKNEKLNIDIPQEDLANIVEFIFEKGEIMFQKYVELILNVPINSVLENTVDALTCVIVEFPDQAIQWLDNIIKNTVPSDCLSESEKADFGRDFEFGSDSIHTIHRYFALLSRRSKKRMNRGLS